MLKILKSVINTLDGVEVKGRDNLDRVLGSIRALETVCAMVEAQSKPQPAVAKKEVNADG